MATAERQMPAERPARDDATRRTVRAARVTVVVVTHCSARVVGDLLELLPDALAGVDEWELVVADNASTDDTLAVVKRVAPYAHIVEIGRNAGYSAGLNAAVAAATGDAVLLLNPDIRPRKGFAEALLRSLGGDVGIVVPQLLEEDGEISHSLRREPTVLRALGEAVLGGTRAGRITRLGEVVRNDADYRVAHAVDWASGAAQLIDRRLLDEVGPWDESFFLYSEETEFALRASDAGWQTYYQPEAVAIHIGGDSSTSPQLWALLTRNRVRLFQRRHSPARTALFWMATVLNEALRAATGSRTHRAGLRALTMPHARRPGARRVPRVLIIVQNLPVPKDRRVWREAQALTDAGFHVSVISPKAPGDPSFERREGVDLYKYPPPPAARGSLSYFYEFAYCWLATARLTARVVRRTGIDVVQACNPPDTYFAIAAPLKLFGKRFVFDHHDLSPEVYRARFGRDDGVLLRALYALERATFATADHVISTNESYRRVATERGARSNADVTVVRNGPDLNRMRRGDDVPELRRGSEFLLCYLGVMGPQDGVDTVLYATRSLVHDMAYDVHVALLGDGDCFDELQRLATKLNIRAAVTFTGWADDETIRDYLSTADIGLCPDPKNDFNDASTMNKTLEYMAYELPAVSFDLRETRISAAEACHYVNESHPEAFAKHIALLLDDPSRRAAMAGIARSRIRDRLAWQHQEKAYLNAMAQVMDCAEGGP